MDLKIRNFEIEILKTIRKTSSSFWNGFFQIVSYFGESIVVIGIIVIIYFMYDKQFGKKLIFTLFSSLLINNVIKGIVKYPRPFVYDPSLDPLSKNTATGYSFPSGHTQTASTLYFGIAKGSKIERKINIDKFIVWVIAIALIISVGLSRIILAVHYPKDVIVGLILGIASVYIFFAIYDKFSRKNEFLINIIFLLIFFPFLFIFNKETYELIYPYKDFYTVYSLFLGYTLGSVIDNKYVNYSCNTSIKKKIIRTIVSFLIIIVCVGGLKIVFPKNNMFFVFLRYFLSTFITMGIIPLLLKNNLFKD